MNSPYELNEIEWEDLQGMAPPKRPMHKLQLGLKAILYMIVGVLSVGFATTYSVMGNNYTVYADFQSVGGLKRGAMIEIAGVKIGTVRAVYLTEDDEARVEMKILRCLLQ